MMTVNAQLIRVPTGPLQSCPPPFLVWLSYHSSESVLQAHRWCFHLAAQHTWLIPRLKSSCAPFSAWWTIMFFFELQSNSYLKKTSPSPLPYWTAHLFLCAGFQSTMPDGHWPHRLHLFKPSTVSDKHQAFHKSLRVNGSLRGDCVMKCQPGCWAGVFQPTLLITDPHFTKKSCGNPQIRPLVEVEEERPRVHTSYHPYFLFQFRRKSRASQNSVWNLKIQ